MADIVDLAIENHELRMPHSDSEGRLAALELRHEELAAEIAGLRAELGSHREGEEHHEHSEEEFEVEDPETETRPEPEPEPEPE